MNRTIKKQIWLNREEDCELKRKAKAACPVSYTHLTLPTNREV